MRALHLAAVALLLLHAAAASSTPPPELSVLSTITVGAPNAGQYTQTVIGSDNLPLVVFHDSGNASLAAVHCEDVLCENWTYNTIDKSSQPGNNTEGRFEKLAMGVDGLPIIAYYDEAVISGGEYRLKVAHCNTPDCSNATVTVVDDAGGYFPSITIGGDGFALISFWKNVTTDANGNDAGPSLNVAHCLDVPCTQSVVNALYTGYTAYSSIVYVPGSNKPVISFFNTTSQFAVANTTGSLCALVCSDPECSLPPLSVTVLDDSEAVVGRYTSAMVGSDGLPIVAYTDNVKGRLKTAHCANFECSSAKVYNVAPTGLPGACPGYPWCPYGVYPQIRMHNKFPVISFFNEVNGTAGELQAVLCGTVNCDKTSIVTLSSGGSGYGRDSSLAWGVSNTSLAYASFLDYGNGTDMKAKLLVLSVTERDSGRAYVGV